MTIQGALLMLWVTTATAATAVDSNTTAWRCQNDYEIDCDSHGCQLADPTETTAMRLHFNAEGTYSICAYSGCWEGQGNVLTKESFLIITDASAHWSSPTSDKIPDENVLIGMDLSDQVAMVKVGGFAHPYRCMSDKKSG